MDQGIHKGKDMEEVLEIAAMTEIGVPAQRKKKRTLFRERALYELDRRGADRRRGRVLFRLRDVGEGLHRSGSARLRHDAAHARGPEEDDAAGHVEVGRAGARLRALARVQ